MEDTPKKRHIKKRRKKRKKSPKFIIGVIICILIVSAGAVVALTAPGLKVSEVYCEGNNYTDSADIIAASGIQTGENIFLINTGSAERNTEKIHIIKNATVERVFPDKICIRIEERTPYANLQSGGNYATIDSEGMVVKVYEGADALKIAEGTKPVFEVKTEESVGSDTNNNTEDKKKDENTEDEDELSGDELSEDEEDTEEDTIETGESKKTENKEAPVTEEQTKMYNVPVVSGFETEKAEEGEKIRSKDEEKYNKAIEICKALSESGLLKRCTHIDLTDMGEVKLAVEGRLDVRLGKCENIGYKAMFLAEVIDKKISSTERVIMDYVGNDIYVRANEDGKQRVKQIKKTTDQDEDEKKDENSKNSEDSDDDDQEEENSGKSRKNRQLETNDDEEL